LSALSTIKQESTQGLYDYPSNVQMQRTEQMYASPQQQQQSHDVPPPPHSAHAMNQMRRGSMPHVAVYPTPSPSYTYPDAKIKSERDIRNDSGYGSFGPDSAAYGRSQGQQQQQTSWYGQYHAQQPASVHHHPSQFQQPQGQQQPVSQYTATNLAIHRNKSRNTPRPEWPYEYGCSSSAYQSYPTDSDMQQQHQHQDAQRYRSYTGQY
jgi:hypothetical protein